MDTAQWPQDIGLVKPMEEIVPNACSSRPSSVLDQRRARPPKEQALNCPRCNSSNTKFCYYNNYSLTQPRYFCKTCRRYWTEGGSLRNVPVGGGSRKNKRSSSSSTTTTTTTSTTTTTTVSCNKKLNIIPDHSSQNPKIINEGQDLNLAFPSTQLDYHHQRIPDQFAHELPNIENSTTTTNNNSCSSSTSSSLSALDLLRTGITSRGASLSSFMPMPLPDINSVYSSSGFALQDFKPITLNFGVHDGLGGGAYEGLQSVHHHQGTTTGGRLLFPFEELKPSTTSTDQYDQNRAQAEPSGYWSGMLGGGGSW